MKKWTWILIAVVLAGLIGGASVLYNQLSAVLIDKLKSAFNWIKAHYNVINLVCGALLVFVGVLMMTGTMGILVAWLS